MIRTRWLALALLGAATTLGAQERDSSKIKKAAHNTKVAVDKGAKDTKVAVVKGAKDTKNAVVKGAKDTKKAVKHVIRKDSTKKP